MVTKLKKNKFMNSSFQWLFSKLFVYNILWEDSEVDEKYFMIDDSSSVISVSGAGCGIAGMISKHPASIDTIDTNHHHLALTSLKVEALRNIKSYEKFYRLLGMGYIDNYKNIILELSSKMHKGISQYWNKHYYYFRKNLYREGLTSKMLSNIQFLSGINENSLKEIENISYEERLTFIHKNLLPLFEKRIIKLFVNSPLQLLCLGINFNQKKCHLQELECRQETTDFINVIIHQMKRMALTDIATNWFLWLAFTGGFNHDRQDAVPPYLRKDSFLSAQKNKRTRINFHHNNLFDVLKNKPDNSLTHFNFLDVPDWLTRHAQETLLKEILRTSKDRGIFLQRTVKRDSFIEKSDLKGHFELLKDVSNLASNEDRSCCYKRVNYYRIHKIE